MNGRGTEMSDRNMNLFRRHIQKAMRHAQTARTISLLWLAALAGGAFAFLTQVILARTLGPSDYGRLATGLTIVAMLAPLAGFGLPGFWLKVYGDEGWNAKRWLPASFRFIGLTTAASVALLSIWALVGPHDPSTRNILFALAAYMLSLSIVELVGAKLQLEERYGTLAVWQLLPHVARCAVIAIIALTMAEVATPTVFATAYSMVALLVIVGGTQALVRMRRGQFSLRGHEAGSKALDARRLAEPPIKHIGYQAWPFGLAGVFHLIYFQSAVVLLKYLVSDDVAGLYGAALTVMAAIYLLPGAIYQKFMLPKLHRWAHHDRPRFLQTYRRGNGFMLLLGIVAALVLFAAVPKVIPMLFGGTFEGAVTLLMLLALSIPLRFIASNVGAMLVTQEHMRTKVRYMGAVAALNIVLNLLLIPRFAALGACVSTILSEAVLLALFVFGAKKHLLVSEGPVAKQLQSG